jgi:WbqC-like protein family
VVDPGPNTQAYNGLAKPGAPTLWEPARQWTPPHGAKAGFGEVSPTARTVAVMQPYFYPYPGYYRLLASADTFVLFDCVQFPRRGRVHRASGPDGAGRKRWLTLPLVRQPRDTPIRALAFRPDATAEFAERLARSPWVRALRPRLPRGVLDHLEAPLLDPVSYLEAGLRLTADYLGLETKLLRSSSLALDPALRGQDRVLAACEALGAKTYVNAPGGRGLYQPANFLKRGVDLAFMQKYAGPYPTMLHAFAALSPSDLRAHILEGVVLER